MVLIEKEKLFNLWKSIQEGGLLRIVPEPNNPLRERGSPMLDPNETWWLLRRLEENIQDEGPIFTILELGVADGGGAKIWEQVLLSQAKYLQDEGKGIDNLKNLLYIGIDHTPNILWNYKHSSIDMRTITGDTHGDSTRNQVKQILKEKGNRKVDFLFVDAQHHSIDVKKDFTDYGSFVDRNRIIGFHDTRLFRSWFDEFTGGGVDAVDDPRNEIGFKNEKAVFHKEEFKMSLGTGIFYNLKNQNVVEFRDD